jgi:hypothetical protein
MYSSFQFFMSTFYFVHLSVIPVISFVYFNLLLMLLFCSLLRDLRKTERPARTDDKALLCDLKTSAVSLYKGTPTNIKSNHSQVHMSLSFITMGFSVHIIRSTLLRSVVTHFSQQQSSCWKHSSRGALTSAVVIRMTSSTSVHVQMADRSSSTAVHDPWQRRSKFLYQYRL